MLQKRLAEALQLNLQALQRHVGAGRLWASAIQLMHRWG